MSEPVNVEERQQNDAETASYFQDIPAFHSLAVADTLDVTWRSQEKKMKTMSVGIVLCLNVGVAPPDAIRTSPGAKLMCWEDPHENAENNNTAAETIGKRLAEQYKLWQPKARCKQALDPTLEEVKRTCCSLRRRAKDEPALFHYNGHGVPRPTPSGEMWVFNKNFTQYLPFSVYELQTWMGSPSIFVYDCNGAGSIVRCFNSFAEQRVKEQEQSGMSHSPTFETFHECIQLGACEEGETLPTNPDLPADLFTSCLTTPIETALCWAYATGKKHLLVRLRPEMVRQVPGQISDRRTMLGQLNWIFTAITDSIAWNVFPADLFQKLFRNDLLVAALFRNFLLADRILRSCNCTPISSPKLPNTHNHPLWEAWDMAADSCLAQLPDILNGNAEFQHSPFFSDQLTAFEVWLDMASSDDMNNPPEPLPVVLQVLLSQQHRLRALQLLERFLELGPWAVLKALSVGIFPYVFKLLGSPAQELKPVLISLWTKVLAVDPSCKADLAKSPASPARKPGSNSQSSKAFMYFITTLADSRYDSSLRTMAAFVISVFVDDHPQGREMCLDAGLTDLVISQLQSDDADLRKWLCLMLGTSWTGCLEAQIFAFNRNAAIYLLPLLNDRIPLVRAAALYALSRLVGVCTVLAPPQPITKKKISQNRNNDNINNKKSVESSTSEGSTSVSANGAVAEEDDEADCPQDLKIGVDLLGSLDDGCHVVRAELVVALNSLVTAYKEDFLEIASRHRTKVKVKRTKRSRYISRLLQGLCILSLDPVTLVSDAACTVLLSVGLKSMRKDDHPQQIPVGSRRMTMSNTGDSYSPMPSGASHESPPHWYPSMSKGVTQVAPTDPDTNLHIMSLLGHLGNIAETLSSGNINEFDVQDIQSSLRTPMLAALEAVTGLEEIVCSHGWNGTELIDLKALTIKKMIQEIRETYGVESYVQRQVTGEQMSTPFLKWSCKTFCKWKAAFESTAEEEKREWRDEQNHQTRSAALTQIMAVEARGEKMKLSETIFHSPTKHVADMVQFHPYEKYIIMGNASTGHLCTWGTESLSEISAWKNGSASKLTSMRLINSHDEAILAVGSGDGMVRLWTDICTPYPTMLTGWRAVAKLKGAREGNTGAGLVLEWSQRYGHMFASGDVQYIQLWDACAEARLLQIRTDVPSCVSALNVSPDDNGLLIAGFGNGNVCLFDVRSQDAVVQRFEQHKAWVVQAHLQGGNKHHVISGSRAGDILWWDTRFPTCAVRNLRAYKLDSTDAMRSMAVHNHASLLATATPKQFIKIFNLEGDLLNHHKHYVNFLGEAMGPNSCLGFHPYLPHLAAGTNQKIMSIYAPGR
eukprot:m.109666 g.109666  ORF g.109666 m.109666 type:complete len:1325 (+) comp14009_c0_seq1:230-4204(+)